MTEAATPIVQKYGGGYVGADGSRDYPSSGGYVGGLSAPGANWARAGGAGASYHTFIPTGYAVQDGKFFARPEQAEAAPIFVEPGGGWGDDGPGGPTIYPARGGGGPTIFPGGGTTIGNGPRGDTVLPGPRGSHAPTGAMTIGGTTLQDLLNDLFGASVTKPTDPGQVLVLNPGQRGTGSSFSPLIVLGAVASIIAIAYYAYKEYKARA